ncbi:SCO7613 C-terminal domain-containing membrane protein [Geodermatophilus sp. URMC 64]
MGTPPLPYRARPLQVLLGVGAVLVVSAAAAVVGAFGGVAARLALLLLAVVAAAFSLLAALEGLRSTEETLAACAAGVGLTASALGESNPAAPAAVAVVCLGLHVRARSTAAWPLASWFALQVAVLRAVDDVPDPLPASLFLAVALVGLGIALWGRRVVARVALVTTAPWWVAGVVGGTVTAWTGPGLSRHLAALLLVAAAAGLLPARLRADLDALLGPPVAVPLLAGAVAGAGVAGSLAALGSPGITAAGYAGVLLATTVPHHLSGWRRGLLGPAATAAGSAMALAALIQLSTRADWAALSLLFLLTAVPSVFIAARRPGERPTSVPWAVGCLAAAALLAVPAGILDPLPAAAVLTGLYGAGLVASAPLAVADRPPTLVVSAAAAVAALGLAASAGLPSLAVALGAQGVLTGEFAVWTTRPAGEFLPSAAWWVSAAQLTVATWLAVATRDVQVLEGYTLPLATGLLLAQGPRLAEGPSWPAWGPALLVAAVPSAAMAVVLPGSTRPVVVLTACAVAMVAAGAAGVRAPLVIGAATAVGTALALALATLLWPVAAALVIGAVLVGVGARREQSPTPFFASRLAELR